MKLTITRNSEQTAPIRFSHHGLHLRRKYGGPPWWRYINGLSIRLRGFRVLWVELRKPHRDGKLFVDRTRSTS